MRTIYRAFHAQHGEDKFIVENISLPDNGTFVDVGAGHPVNLSNTYHFEQNGWYGVCIEGDERRIAALKEKRRWVEHAVICKQEGPALFRQSNNLELSTIGDHLQPHDFQRGVTVQGQRLESILEKYQIGKIDLLSLDIEGAELDAWQTFDFAKHQPTVVIVEHNTVGRLSARSEMSSFFAAQHYELVHENDVNFVFLLKGELDRLQDSVEALSHGRLQIGRHAAIRRQFQLEPDDPEGSYQMGCALLQQGRPEEAAVYYRECLRLNPQHAGALINLAFILAEKGKAEEALAMSQRALLLRPDSPELHLNIGTLLRGQGKWDEAARYYRRALQLKPDSAKAWINLGMTFSAQQKFMEAEQTLRQGLGRLPDNAHLALALASAVLRQGRKEEGADLQRQAVRLNPDDAESHYQLGFALWEIGKKEEAVVAYQDALRLRPDHVAAMINLGFALATLGKADAGVALLREAVQRQPQNAEARTTLGVLLGLEGKWHEAVAQHEQALGLNPEHVQAHCNLAYARLIQGDFERGWPEFDWRWKSPRAQQLPPLPQPFWDGAPLDGKAVYVHLEGGWGDVFQFIRYAKLIAARGGRVIVAGQKFFTPLLATCPGIERMLPADAPVPDFSLQSSLLNLPRLFGTTLATIPTHVPYLFAAPKLVEHWRRELSSIDGLRVGINWQGNPQFGWDWYRSIPLGFFEPLSRVEGVRLISLQKGPGAEQLEAFQERFPVIGLDPRRDETAGPFMDTAAILKSLDLLITSDTALAHLAGAMGIPVWVALSSAPDWRWLLDREDYPWYPSMRLFRQKTPGDWQEVFARMARELGKLGGYRQVG